MQNLTEKEILDELFNIRIVMSKTDDKEELEILQKKLNMIRHKLALKKIENRGVDNNDQYKRK